jgi:mannose-6-phosphate isomerase-like protein (cupin superfamily)
MKHVYCPDVQGLDSLSLGLEGSRKMMLRLLSEDSVWIEIEPGGHTPDHAHSDKERGVVMSGIGAVKVGEERIDIKEGDFIEFDPDEQHQVINTGDNALVMLCFRNQK